MVWMRSKPIINYFWKPYVLFSNNIYLIVECHVPYYLMCERIISILSYRLLPFLFVANYVHKIEITQSHEFEYCLMIIIVHEYSSCKSTVDTLLMNGTCGSKLQQKNFDNVILAYRAKTQLLNPVRLKNF